MMGGALGGAVGSSVGAAGGKALADDITKRGYGIKSGRGQRNPLIKPAPSVPTFSSYAQLASGQLLVAVFKMVELVNVSCKFNMCIEYMSLTNFDLHRLCKKMDLPT